MLYQLSYTHRDATEADARTPARLASRERRFQRGRAHLRSAALAGRTWEPEPLQRPARLRIPESPRSSPRTPASSAEQSRRPAQSGSQDLSAAKSRPELPHALCVSHRLAGASEEGGFAARAGDGGAPRTVCRPRSRRRAPSVHRRHGTGRSRSRRDTSRRSSATSQPRLPRRPLGAGPPPFLGLERRPRSTRPPSSIFFPRNVGSARSRSAASSTKARTFAAAERPSG